MLEYDNSAFYYFAMSLSTFYLVPSWKAILARVYTSTLGADPVKLGATARTSDEKKKAEQLKNSVKGLKTLNDSAFLTNCAITLVLTLLWFWMLVKVQNEGEIHSFDPYQILGVDGGSDLKMIKKAYRSKSLQFHPDKNPGDKHAENMFMNIAKAYEALTDPIAQENYKLYGNPDGKQSLEVSIGLPTFLLDRANRNLVLVMYLVIMVGLVPYGVWKYYSDSSKYGENRVMYESYSWFYHALSKEISVKQLPEVLAGAAEFRQSNRVQKGEMEEIKKILDSVKQSMSKPAMSHPTLLKGNVLLHTHVLRETQLLKSTQSDALSVMLKNSTSLTEAMISICKNQDFLKATLACIDFQQCLTQAMWGANPSPFLQLPHVTKDDIEEIVSNNTTEIVEVGSKNTAADVSDQECSFKSFLSISNDKKKLPARLTAEEKLDILTACDIIPKITFTTKVFVDDDEDDNVYEGDLLTILVTIERQDKAKLVYAPHFPFPKQEGWWILLGNSVDNRILHVEKVTSSGTTVEHRIKMQAPKQGQYRFNLQIKSNAYIGLDHSDEISVVTLDASKLPEYKIHPEDAELDDEPTLFEEMMAANVEKDDSDDEDEGSDDEDDSDDDSVEEEGIRELSAAEIKRRQAQNNKDDDSSDDDSSVEEVHAD